MSWRIKDYHSDNKTEARETQGIKEGEFIPALSSELENIRPCKIQVSQVLFSKTSSSSRVQFCKSSVLRKITVVLNKGHLV